MAKITTVCCECGKKLGSYNEPSLSEDMTSHGYCDKCADKRRKEVEAYKGGKR